MKTQNILCGIMLALAAAFPFQAGAGTLFYVPIPAAGSDTQSGIAPTNGYSGAVHAGNAKGAGRTVSGVSFGALTGTGNTRTANGVTLSAATGSLMNGGGKAESIQADGATADLFSGMIFNDGAGDNSEQYVVLDPATLTAGKTYDLRVYVCNASGENRQVSLSFAGDGKPAVSTDFFNEDDATTSAGGFTEPNQVYYINYRFTWDGVSTPGFTATQKFGSTPFCLYALTNQEAGGDAGARPTGAMLAAVPEPVAAAPSTRGSRTNPADTTEDIGVSSDVFYSSESLRGHGRWVTVGTYGRCWQPTGVDVDWQPYTHGRWAFSPDDGWVWDSDEDFGWATYHYGRWFREEDSGWYWVPGKVWAPAWVSWRHGHSYVGWAPLPPLAMAAAGVGIGAWADHRWGIGPHAYSFVNVRDFGAPSMAKVLIPRQQNPSIMTATNNVTNIVSGRRGIYSGGPNFQAVNNTLVRAGSQIIPTVRIDRRTGTRPLTPDGKFSQLTAGILAVTAPNVIRTKKPISLPPVAATIAAPKFDKGWSGLPDPKHAAALQAKIANETPGTTAKNAPAILPGTPPSASVGAGTKPAGPLKPFRPAKPADTTLIKPGQPATPTGAPPSQPVKTIGAPIIKPGQPASPTVVPPPQPHVATPQPVQPVKPTAATPPQPVQPVKPVDAPLIKPGKPAKPTSATIPTQPVPAPPKPTPTPEPVRPTKRTPQPANPVPAPVKAATPAPVVPKSIPVATPPPRPAAPAPVAKPAPRPAPPVVIPVRPPPQPPAPVPAKPQPPAAAPAKGGKPTPTPTPAANG